MYMLIAQGHIIKPMKLPATISHLDVSHKTLMKKIK